MYVQLTRFRVFCRKIGNMNVVESLYLCYKGLARTRSVFKDSKYHQPDHTVVSEFSNAEVNGVLMNILVRVKSKTFFCVQLRVDDYENARRYYIGVNRRYENICVAYIHVAPMPQTLAAYIWPEGLRVKEINLETIRQALLRAGDINLHMLAPPRRITMRYEDLTAADDGNQDKASISNASDLPWDLSRCATNAVESFHENKPANNERRISRKASSPCKRSKSERIPEEDSDDEGNEREEGDAVWATAELLEQTKKERLFNFQELFA